MWKFKQFMPKEHAGLEGRMVDFGNLKVQVRNAIAEGGFSCVYLARDAANPSKQYALKHMICQDEESFDLAVREISVMKMLKGHPNVVALIADTILDMGRTKEALLALEFCEKSLVTVLENRGAGYFEEKQILLIFRDVCNAVFAMHCQSPPVAHRDLKAENVLLGADGAWKLCDFGSISTNHKCFSRPEEMGIEEDNIRKHTTPAYRAPEMWDLYRREVISEKVDMWALGCLLYRICYLKSSFDGESKLQILNGNYRIPELPKYNGSIIKLIKDMLQASPDDRPDITQVWFRVNELLPPELQKDLPDNCATGTTVSTKSVISDAQDEGTLKRTNMMPHSSTPSAASSREHPEIQHSKSTQGSFRSSSTGGSLGAFWSTQHAQDSLVAEDQPVFDKETINQVKPKGTTSVSSVFDKEPINQVRPKHTVPVSSRDHEARSPPRSSIRGPESGLSKDFEIRFSPNGSEYTEKTKISNAQNKASFQDDTFNAFVAEFDTSKFSSVNAASNIESKNRSAEEELAAEVDRLKQELKQVNLEKEEMTSKYEKLSAICRTQRQEIQELKNALAATGASSVSKDNLKSQTSPGVSQSDTPPREKIEGSLPELKQVFFSSSPFPQSSESKPWSAFDGEAKVQNVTKSSHHPSSVRTVRGTSNGRNVNRDATASSSTRESWGFGQDNFRAAPSVSEKSETPVVGGSTSQRFGVPTETKKFDVNQPSGWADF